MKKQYFILFSVIAIFCQFSEIFSITAEEYDEAQQLVLNSNIYIPHIQNPTAQDVINLEKRIEEAGLLRGNYMADQKTHIAILALQRKTDEEFQAGESRLKYEIYTLKQEELKKHRALLEESQFTFESFINLMAQNPVITGTIVVGVMGTVGIYAYRWYQQRYKNSKESDNKETHNA